MAQQNRKKNQIVAISVVGAGVVGMFIIIGLMMNNSSVGALPNRSTPTVDETIISDRTSAASPEMSWITTGRLELERLKNEQEEQRKLLDQQRRDSAREVEAVREEYEDTLLQLMNKVSSLETELEDTKAQPRPAETEQKFNAAAQTPVSISPQNGATPIGPGNDFIERAPTPRTTTRSNSSSNPSSSPVVPQTFGRKFTLASIEADNTEEREVRRLGTYLPAGSYAPAIVLSGADAATNVSNRDNPIPVLFRITGSAVTASLGNRSPAKVNLKGCTVQGSATGDLSSERVKVRLISMTCVNKTGDVLETKVAGYMAGSGKEGVRGHVVSREGSNVRNAAIAGALGGLAKGLSAGATASLNQEDASVSQILRSAGAGTLTGGAEEAASTLADYYIKRAEQYQPVISLYGGTKVELVFLEGVELGQ